MQTQIIWASLKEEKYKQYHYFNPAARNAIYAHEEANSEIVWNYTYDMSEAQEDWLRTRKTADNKAEYVIKHGETEYHLKVNCIRLKLFNTGIGIILFELENYLYPACEDVLKINDFGI